MSPPSRERKDLSYLRKHLPLHVAFNVALLIRGIRPVIQLDTQEDGVRAIQRWTRWLEALYPDMRHIEHTLGILLFFPHRRMPKVVRAALEDIQNSKGNDVKKHVGTALQLVCSAKHLESTESFRIMIGIMDTQGNEHYFKQQMCASASKIVDVFRELGVYESLAQEMGMIATTVKVVRRHSRK